MPPTIWENLFWRFNLLARDAYHPFRLWWIDSWSFSATNVTYTLLIDRPGTSHRLTRVRIVWRSVLDWIWKAKGPRPPASCRNAIVFLKNGHSRPIFLYFRIFNTLTENNVQYKSLPMTGFEPQTSGIGSNGSTNWATTTALGNAIEPTSFWPLKEKNEIEVFVNKGISKRDKDGRNK